MSKTKYSIVLILIIISFKDVFSKDIKINEMQLINQKSPLLQLYSADEINSKIDLLEFENNFNSKVNISMYHQIDHRKSLTKTGYDKPTSPIDTREISWSKSYMFGGNIKLKLAQSSLTNPFVTNSSSARVGVEIALDLIKGLWKKNTQNAYMLQKKSLSLQRNIKKYKTYLFKNNLRKLYWNLVANDLSLKVLKKLLINTRKQVTLIRKKYEASISDIGDYSRIQAQEKSTEALIISYSYQKEQLFKTLKELLPKKLASHKLSLSTYYIDQSVKKISLCAAQIVVTGIQYSNSLLSEQNNLTKSLREYKDKIDKNYNSVDLKFVGNFDKVGSALNVNDSITDLSQNADSAYSVGINLTIPIGSVETQKLKISHNRLRSEATLNKNIGKMKAFHEQTVSMITLLNQAISNQVSQNKFLKSSLKSSRLKYKQARISIEQLILEENNLLQSELNIIRTKLSIVETLLDYFSVFNKTKCDFNIITLI